MIINRKYQLLKIPFWILLMICVQFAADHEYGIVPKIVTFFATFISSASFMIIDCKSLSLPWLSKEDINSFANNDSGVSPLTYAGAATGAAIKATGSISGFLWNLLELPPGIYTLNFFSEMAGLQFFAALIPFVILLILFVFAFLILEAAIKSTLFYFLFGLLFCRPVRRWIRKMHGMIKNKIITLISILLLLSPYIIFCGSIKLVGLCTDIVPTYLNLSPDTVSTIATCMSFAVYFILTTIMLPVYYTKRYTYIGDLDQT